jgi:MYXO-CTERM domain-containing protein
VLRKQRHSSPILRIVRPPTTAKVTLYRAGTHGVFFSRCITGVITMRARNLLMITGMVLGIASPAISRAAIVQTAVEPGTDIPIGGSVTFPSLTGDSSAGVILSFAGFSQADITSISWTITPGTYQLTALDLNARTGDTPCDLGTTCSYSSLRLTPTFEQRGGGSCGFSDDGSPECLGEAFQEPIAFQPTSVPEPSTWMLGLIGLLGLGSLRRARALLVVARREQAA